MHATIDVSYLCDTIMLLRYFELHGEIRQVVSVLKQRFGEHEHTLRELRISKAGIYVGEPLTAFHGILTGIPHLTESASKNYEPNEAEGKKV